MIVNPQVIPLYLQFQRVSSMLYNIDDHYQRNLGISLETKSKEYCYYLESTYTTI